MKQTKCKTKIRTDSDVLKVLSRDLTHTHEVNVRKTEWKILRVNAKRKAYEDLSEDHQKSIDIRQRTSAQFIHY